MSRRTTTFIQNSNNGHYIAAWRDIAKDAGTHPSTDDAAYVVTSSVDDNKYIYINP